MMDTTPSLPLKLRRLPIDTYREAVVYLPRRLEPRR